MVGEDFTQVSNAGMTLTEASVPEPASIALLGIGIIGYVGLRRLTERCELGTRPTGRGRPFVGRNVIPSHAEDKSPR